MLQKNLFILAHQIVENNFYSTYRKLIQNQWKSYKELKDEQEKQLRLLINYSFENIPFYHKLFHDLKLSPSDIKNVEDLKKLPILKKQIIKENWEDFKPINLNKISYYEGDTGGSTGTPFKYRLGKFDRILSGALLYRGWGYGGYELGDKMVFLGGVSLNIGTEAYLVKRTHEVIRNLKKLSSFDMGEEDMREYVNIINSFRPKFIRGYASSIYFFSKWIEENNLKIHQPLTIFTTADKLYSNMRASIETVFNCEVYDGYGLNDGGISAFECSEHCGLHIDTERSIMEVVDKDGNEIESGEGNLLATSLYNYAMPFIRYDTGDVGTITDEICSCGRGHKFLKDLVGRTVDVLVTPEGKNIQGFFFDIIIGEYAKEIKQYQIIQEKLDKIVIRIVAEEDFDKKQLVRIREMIRKKSAKWNVEFKFVERIETTDAGKYKFIINKIHDKFGYV